MKATAVWQERLEAVQRDFRPSVAARANLGDQDRQTKELRRKLQSAVQEAQADADADYQQLKAKASVKRRELQNEVEALKAEVRALRVQKAERQDKTKPTSKAISGKDVFINPVRPSPRCSLHV